MVLHVRLVWEWILDSLLSIKEYIGETYLNSPYLSDEKDQDVYKFKYRLNNLATTKVYEEYFIYDAIGMVGSVGGTLGKYIQLILNCWYM